MQASPNLNNYTKFFGFYKVCSVWDFLHRYSKWYLLILEPSRIGKNFWQKETALGKLHPCFAVVWS